MRALLLIALGLSTAAGADDAALTRAHQAYQTHLNRPDDRALHRQALVAAAVAADAAPADIRAHLLLGSVYLRQRNNRLALEQAADSFLTVLELSPGDVRARLLLGEAYYLQRRFYSARQVWLGLLRQGAGDLSATLLAQTLRAYLLNGDLEAGLAELPELRWQAPDNPWLAALHAGLLHAKARTGADDGTRARLAELRRWWKAADAPAELRRFVMARWLEG